MYFPFFNPTYFLFALPALALGLYAQYRVQTVYQKYQRVRNRTNIVGVEAAQRLLAANGMHHVGIQETRGTLTDHYDPRNKTLYLSQGVARSPSVAALGIVAHEVGHAIQDAQQYTPLKLRSGMVPVVQLGSWLGPIIFMAGLFLPIPNLALIGLLLFSATAVFSIVTLPVEFDASKRAIAILNQGGLTTVDEEKGVRDVLGAAALTYVAAAFQAISTVLYYLFILTGGRRRD